MDNRMVKVCLAFSLDFGVVGSVIVGGVVGGEVCGGRPGGAGFE
jgi:hypothetical protein